MQLYFAAVATGISHSTTATSTGIYCRGQPIVLLFLPIMLCCRTHQGWQNRGTGGLLCLHFLCVLKSILLTLLI